MLDGFDIHAQQRFGKGKTRTLNGLLPSCAALLNNCSLLLLAISAAVHLTACAALWTGLFLVPVVDDWPFPNPAAKLWFIPLWISLWTRVRVCIGWTWNPQARSSSAVGRDVCWHWEKLGSSGSWRRLLVILPEGAFCMQKGRERLGFKISLTVLRATSVYIGSGFWGPREPHPTFDMGPNGPASHSMVSYCLNRIYFVFIWTELCQTIFIDLFKCCSCLCISPI